MGNCAEQCRFSTQARIRFKQAIDTPFSTSSLPNKKNQIILKPLCYLSAPKQTKINTSNTRASTQRPTSIVDVIDEYNHEVRVAQNQKLHEQLNLVLTQSYYVEQPCLSMRSTVLNRQAKKGLNSDFLCIKQRVGHYHQNKEIHCSLNPKQKQSMRPCVKSTTRH